MSKKQIVFEIDEKNRTSELFVNGKSFGKSPIIKASELDQRGAQSELLDDYFSGDLLN